MYTSAGKSKTKSSFLASYFLILQCIKEWKCSLNLILKFWGQNSFFLNSIIQWIQFISVDQSYPALCNPKDCIMPGFPVHHQILELAQIHVCWVSDPIQSSHPPSSPSPPAFNLFQHYGIFQWVSSLHQVAKLLELQLQYQSFQWIFRTDFL